MTLAEVRDLLDARIVCGDDKLNDTVDSGFGSDLMSDVLAFVHQKTLLLTGLLNQHVLRTAEMLDMGCVVFVGGKMPSEEIAEAAVDQGLVVFSTDKTLYESCGILHSCGLPAVERLPK